MRVVDRKVVISLALAALIARQIFTSFRFTTTTDGGVQQRPSDVSSSPSSAASKTGATFMGMDLVFIPKPRSSVVHCVGENFLPKLSTGYRSCQFRHFCWDIQDQEFGIVQSPQQRDTLQLLNQMETRYARTCSQFNTTVSTAATNEAWLKQGTDAGWFPKTVPLDDSGFYQLPEDVVIVPVHFPEGGSSPRQVLFDFLLPIYTLQSMFDLIEGKRLLVANLGNSCSSVNQTNCNKEVLKLMPLMNQDVNLKERFLTRDAKMEWADGAQTSTLQSTRICANYGAAGIGALTDHGIHKSHGERKKDYMFVQNSGRGPLLYDFRSHLLKNVGLAATPKDDSNLPLKVTVSISESKKSGVQDFQKQVQTLQDRYPQQEQLVAIQGYNVSDLPLRQQMEIASTTHVYISMMGDGAVPAFFLPKGATLILFYNDHNEMVSQSKPQAPIKLDWDLWNNLSHLRVHWLPLSTKDDGNDLKRLLRIVEAALNEDQKKVTDAPSSAKEPDGVFNGLEVRLVEGPPKSSVHCVGDNFQQQVHILRSCHFQYMCLDLSSSAPRIFSLHHSGWTNTADLSVSIGHTIRFTEDSAWFPLAGPNTTIQSFYELANDVVWAPFHAEQPNIHNPGHLLWDYFLPFFNLLVMFGLEGLPLLVSIVDDKCTKAEGGPCWKLISKFLPLMGVDPATFRNTANSELKIPKGPRRSNLVCAKHAVAGIGMLTDHGWNRHGQRIEDYRDSHNVGRGPLFFAFRNYVIRSMGIEEERPLKRPYKVVFSTHSSKNPARRLGFEKQIEAVRTAFSSNELVAEQHVLAELPLKRQVALATETTVFVTVVGGSACTGTFLPRGSTVILFFNDVNEFADHAPRKDFPSMIDWDFWNNASYLRVHWLPIRTMNDDIDMKVLTEIIRGDILTLDSVR